eukprot:jgi/Undpi1/32/HiC_scaffold_1.g00032.m1
MKHGSWPSGVDGVTHTAVPRRGFGGGSGEADENGKSAEDAPGAGPGAGVGAGVGTRRGVVDERVLGIGTSGYHHLTDHAKLHVAVPAASVDSDNKVASENDYLTADQDFLVGDIDDTGKVYYVDLSAADPGCDEKVSTGNHFHTALEIAHIDVAVVIVEGEYKVCCEGHPNTALEDVANQVYVPAVDVDGDNQATPGDHRPTSYEAPDVTKLAFNIESDGKASSTGGDAVIDEESNVNASDDDKATTGNRLSTSHEAFDVAELALDIESDEKVSAGDGHAMACEVPNVTVPTVSTDGEDKVDRGSVWATILMDGAKGALPTCAVGEKPTDAAIHAVPAPVSTASNIDDGRPSSSVGVVAPRPWGWKWGNMVAFIYTCVEVASLGFLATLPLRVGDKVTPRAEDMAYWKRFIAVSILRMRAKRSGDRKKSRALQAFLGLWICHLWGMWYVVVPAAALAATIYVATRFWVEKYIEQIIFELLQDYFAVTVLMEDERALEVYSHAPGNCIMAKFPIGLVEVVHDVLGVRRARKDNRKDMFADGREGVAVVAGGAEKPLVSEAHHSSSDMTTELVRKTCTDKDFILPVYVSGASRTHPLLPGRIYGIMRTLRSKVIPAGCI